MPELPEVETTVRELNKKVRNRAFLNVWTDFPRMIKRPKSFKNFEKEILSEKILKVWRRGKNVIFDLSGEKTLLIHQKLTGHLLVGKWKLKNGQWKVLTIGPLQEKVNQFIHLMFYLEGSLMLGLSDLRKFGKVELWNKKDFVNEIKKLGPEPLDKSFSFSKFKSIITNKRGKIKQILMDQSFIVGIGNIYSDEILWEAKVNPLKESLGLKEGEFCAIYRAMKKILKKAIKLKGDSMSDYRLPNGKKGAYQKIHKVYKQERRPCKRCGVKIKRIKLGGRSARYCPKCQK